MADPFEAENDDEWSQWFAALHDSVKERVIEAVFFQSNECTIKYWKITHFPDRFFRECCNLTVLHLGTCRFAALPDSLGQLQALTKLDLYECTSLADESKDLARRLIQCNKKIRDGPLGSPERFHMTTYDFAATILFGSSSRYGAGAVSASGQVGGSGLGVNGSGVGGANDEAENDGPPRRRPRRRRPPARRRLSLIHI